MHGTPSETPPTTPPFTPGDPDDPDTYDPSPDEPTPPVSDPSVDTTKKEAPGPRSPGVVKVDTPKLPHERDESVDMTKATPHKKMEQAYRDVQRGLQDTDRGPPSDKAYKKL